VTLSQSSNLGGAVEVYEKIVQLKMTAPNDKRRLPDVADTMQFLCIIQSISLPKAKPFKTWLAQMESLFFLLLNNKPVLRFNFFCRKAKSCLFTSLD
jgi:hypothetical protein